MTELWKSIPGYEGIYEASSLGRIRSLERIVNYRDGRVFHYDTREIYTHAPNSGGYLCTTLNDISTGRKETFGIHELVCMAFHGLPPTAKCETRHLDGNKRNNRAENLAWGTRHENREDSRRHGVLPEGDKHGLAKITDAQVREIQRRRAAGESGSTLAEEFGIDRGYVYALANCTRKRARRVSV
jgi:hypothetical protein